MRILIFFLGIALAVKLTESKPQFLAIDALNPRCLMLIITCSQIYSESIKEAAKKHGLIKKDFSLLKILEFQTSIPKLKLKNLKKVKFMSLM